MKPIRLGEFSQDEEDEQRSGPAPASPPFTPPCDNCMHRLVCGVLAEIKKCGAPFGEPIAVGFCPFHLPAFEEEDAAKPVSDPGL